jgi:hypothetical protein
MAHSSLSGKLTKRFGHIAPSKRSEHATHLKEIDMNANLKTIGAAVVLILSAGAVSAQSAHVKLPSVAVPPNEQADKLKREAMKFYEQVSTLRRAATMHEREAALRVEADPLKIEALDLAARLYSYSGDHERGTALMEKAARSALLRGDVMRAAHSYLDAAFMALKLKNGERAANLIHEADLLALSPLLSVADKDAIVRRINPARETMGSSAR